MLFSPPLYVDKYPDVIFILNIKTRFKFTKLPDSHQIPTTTPQSFSLSLVLSLHYNSQAKAKNGTKSHEKDKFTFRASRKTAHEPILSSLLPWENRFKNAPINHSLTQNCPPKKTTLYPPRISYRRRSSSAVKPVLMGLLLQ